MSFHVRKSERGIAMLLVMFALLLLTVVGLGMMYSTNMETSINSNFRDKQIAFYSALAGLQEARDRIQPATHNIVAPTTLPATGFPNVIYIVSDFATVKPWDPTNRYFDTELCQENVMALSGTPGVPCTAADIPMGTSWFSYIDHSLSASAPWNLPNPLDLKWTRITLKGNNMTPFPVNGDPTDTAQTCWTGTNQISTPSTYTAGCQPIGGVTAVTVVTSGTSYTSAPTVVLAGGGGTGAAATAVLGTEITGYVSSVAVDNGGAGYTSAPAVSFGSGNATATAVLSTTGTTVTTDGSVTAVALTDGGTGYTSAPAVSFSGPGSGATATAVLSTTGTTVTSGYVSSATVVSGGTLYTSSPTVSFVGGGGGSGATAVATLASTGSVKTVSVGSLGTQCYSQASDVQVAFTGGGGTGAAATATLEAGRSCVYSLTVPAIPQCTQKLEAARGYNPIDQKSGLTLVNGNQSASLTLFVSSANDKTPTATSVQNPGYDATGYSTTSWSSRLQLPAGEWADCGNISATVTTGYRIASINVTSGGTGYTSVPSVTVTGGVGTTSNPTATATLGYAVNGVSITNGGSGYHAAPIISLSGGGGSGAAAIASIVTETTTVYPVASVNVTSGGNGYTSVPSVTFTGGSGSGATAIAVTAPVVATTYPVASITVTSGGSGYDPAFPPAVTLSGGGGAGALATATVATMTTGALSIDHIDVTAQGSGYTSNPTVTLVGGGGTGATAIAQVGGGTKFGKVWMLTSFAETRSGGRSMLQMEVASPVMGFAIGGALTLDGPNPLIDAMPNSNLFRIEGDDDNSCMEAPEADHPAIDGYDDPDADPPTHSVATIIDSLPRPDHYTGSGGTPSVQNGFASLGETMTTPEGLQAALGSFYNAPGSHHYDSTNVGSFHPATTVNSSVNYVDGDLTLNGNATGRGILVVTGTLTMSGDFNWYGLIFVVGDGHVEYSGGGNGRITGSVFVAKIWDNYTSQNLLSSLGSPTFNWNGGGGNGIYYDHCYATNLLTAIPPPNYVSTKPLKILSFRILPY